MRGWSVAMAVGQAGLLAGLILAWQEPAPVPVAPANPLQGQVDFAIEKALAYLAASQSPSGAWASDHMGESPACTSLAIMAFLAAGHVPEEGPYAQTVSRAVNWVLLQQRPDGLIIDERTHGPFYSHGISTLMLAEVLGMSSARDAPRIREALEKAVRLILVAQDQRKDRFHEGGWRYSVSSHDSDLSVTGWQLLALRAAKNVGCDVPADYIDRAVAYVKRCHVPQDGGFGYQPSGGSTAVRTGTGILCLEICGQHLSNEALAGGDFLLRRPLMPGDRFQYYGVYYCSVGTFQLGDRYWIPTRDHIRNFLLASQLQDGSWLERHGEEGGAGPVYCTGLAVLALAVEYQYLPIYQR